MLIKCVCIKCSKLLLEVDDELRETIDKMSNKKRYSFVTSKASKIKTCYECGAVQPSKFIKEGIGKIHAIWKNLSVDIPISAPKPYSKPSENRVETLTMTLEESISLINLLLFS